MNLRITVSASATLCLLLTCCSDEAPNVAPTATIDSPGQDTIVIWPDWTIDMQGTATDIDGSVTGHEWDFGFNRYTEAEDPGPYTYEETGTDTITYQAWDNDGAPSATAQVVVTVLGPPPEPEPGGWSGLAEFGELAFTVNAEGDAITVVSVTLRDWTCGGATWNQTLTAPNPSGWPITATGIEIETTFAGVDLSMTMQGTFGADHHVSGSWSGTTNGETCSGSWAASSDAVTPNIAVFMSSNFTQTVSIVGFHWLPGTQVRLEVDNGADGSVDFHSTRTAGSSGDVHFHEGHLPPPFTIAEGDLVTMSGGGVLARYRVLYVTLGLVDAGRDLVTGRARAGTGVSVIVSDPALPPPQGHEVVVTADANGQWSADFSGVFDILPGSSCGVSAFCVFGGPSCGGSTNIVWP